MNEEFEALRRLPKIFAKFPVKLPLPGDTKRTFDLKSLSSEDRFFLDIDRSNKIELSKLKIQKRYVATRLPLVRIEVNCPPHMNPDGRVLSRNHIHIYREDENPSDNLPWAFEFEEIKEFQNISTEFMSVFYAFCTYCHIQVENIQGVV